MINFDGSLRCVFGCDKGNMFVYCTSVLYTGFSVKIMSKSDVFYVAKYKKLYNLSKVT